MDLIKILEMLNGLVAMKLACMKNRDFYKRNNRYSKSPTISDLKTGSVIYASVALRYRLDGVAQSFDWETHIVPSNVRSIQEAAP